MDSTPATSMAPEPHSRRSPQPAVEEQSAPRSGAVTAGLFVAVFGLLLGSFPARNPELWGHLAAGRTLVHGAIDRLSATWLYDVASYGLFQAAGGAGLVAVKAAVLAALAFVLVRRSRTTGGWLVPAACTVLAVLVVGNRALLAPATVSYLLLAAATQMAWRAAPAGSVWPGWRLVGLFVVWGNLDRWFVLGLGVLALIEVGRWLDERSGGRGLLRRLGVVAVLAAAAAANPAHLAGFALPAELGWGSASARPAMTSPFERAYLSALGGSPAALAYYPLLGLSLVSFLLVLPRRRWQWVLPWLGLAVLSAFQVRSAPFFAVVAGPVLAWNLQEFFARRGQASLLARPRRPIGRAVAALTGVLAVAFLASAWPGWLQHPPFEPRRWAVQPPAGLAQAAAAVCRGHAEGTWSPGTRTLHLSRDTAAAFAWFCPEDHGTLDLRLAAEAGAPGAVEQLKASGFSRVVVHAAARGFGGPALARLLADPDRWPLLHLEGGVVLFGLRDPGEVGAADAFHEREVDLDRLAFRPADGEKAPSAPTASRPRWWDAFWKPAPPAAGDRVEAAVLLLLAEVRRESAPARHLAEWEAVQAAGLAAAATGRVGPAGAADVAFRLTVLRPPVLKTGAAQAPITQVIFACQRLFALARDDVPVGVLYAALRAARRAVSANPEDAAAHLLLGQCYRRLLMGTRERMWAVRLPRLAQLRQAQASAALNRAVILNPGLARAHLELGRLYQQIGYLDLALTHLRAYRDAADREGAGGGREAVSDAELEGLTKTVEGRQAEFAAESARVREVDRAGSAVKRGLAGKARALLLASDVSAFGAEGTALELDLLLRTGRAADVRDWTSTEFKGSLGAAGYHWLRTQALAAVGEYAAADAELTELSGRGEPDPARTARVLAALVGRAVLDGQPTGPGLPDLLSRSLARFEVESGVGQAIAELARRADAFALRGLLALEAGEVDRAGAAFRAALAHSAESPTSGGLEFAGRPAARGGLGLLR